MLDFDIDIDDDDDIFNCFPVALAKLLLLFNKSQYNKNKLKFQIRY